MKFIPFFALLFTIIFYSACDKEDNAVEVQSQVDNPIPVTSIVPVIITEKVKYDTDDPAIWIDRASPENSLVIGTDKHEKGALYVFDLKGNILEDKVVYGLKRPNNVDVEYNFIFGGESIDIAVVSERLTHKLRIFKVPDMEPIDQGGIPIFEGETKDEYREVMGISLYKSPVSGNMYAIAGRKNGPTDGTYLWQYLLEDNGEGGVKATLVRKFGNYSGAKEIEAIAIDDKLGYIYYSDETVGVRKYYADPEKGNMELALFAFEGFKQDQEGISIYEATDSTGYILVSDQQNNRFQIYTREGTGNMPHQHKLVKTINVETLESDGSEGTSTGLNDQFSKGLFVAMSSNRTFHYYSWEDIAGDDLKAAQKGNSAAFGKIE
jgi:3-phytase